MSGVVTAAGDVLMLQGLVARALTLRLFVNDRVPAKGDALGDYTEATGGGYASVGLSADAWTVMPTTPAVATHAEVLFAFSGLVGDVYGYLISDDAGNGLLVAERFVGGPFDVRRNGDKIRVTPRIQQLAGA